MYRIRVVVVQGCCMHLLWYSCAVKYCRRLPVVQVCGRYYLLYAIYRATAVLVCTVYLYDLLLCGSSVCTISGMHLSWPRVLYVFFMVYSATSVLYDCMYLLLYIQV